MDLVFNIRRAHRITGISVEMIDYLCRIEVLNPKAGMGRTRGRGRARQFAFADLVLLRAIKELLDQGVSVKRMKTGLRKLRVKYGSITPTHLPAAYLVTDGQNVFLRNADTLVDLFSEPGQYVFSFIIDVAKAREDVMQAMNG